MNLQDIPTPCYVVDQDTIIENLEILKSVMNRTGAKILLAQKAFSMYSIYPLIGKYLAGTTASGLFEARLGHEEMPGTEVHVYNPAYKREDMQELVTICDHIVFNTPKQWKQYKEMILGMDNPPSCGIRVNPEYSEIETDIYNPCFTGSRMGTVLSEFEKAELAGDLTGIEGIHFHCMCEQNADVLERILKVVEEKFGTYLYRMKWLNFGGGHHITRSDYDIEKLVSCIRHMKETYDVDIYLEPGEAIALNAGWLVTTVLDTLENGMQLAILDTSAACHMPDVLEMPYRPEVIGAGKPNEKAYTYRLGGPTCLAGDILGDYSFDEPLKPGDRLFFCDMAIYSMVKNNTFNGMPLPSIALKIGDEVKVIKNFGYEDFKRRL